MSSDEEIAKLVESRKRLEAKIAKLEEELSDLKQVLGLIDSHLLEKGFKTADTLTKQEQMAESYEQVLPIKSNDGTPLCTLYLGKGELKIVPFENLKFRVTTPPFQQFLINKVLGGMASKDREEAIAGSLEPDDILTYRVLQDGDLIREIVIKNVRDEKRVATLKNAIRWTFDKMYEKTKLIT